MRTGLARLCRSLALMLLTATLVHAQAQAFGFMKDLIPENAGPVLGLADFDQDGDLDLLTNTTGIYLNDGNGAFTPHPVLSAVIANSGPLAFGAAPAVAIGDLDGDGFPDVVANPGGPNEVRKWMNQGNGVLIYTPATPAPPYVPLWLHGVLALGDVDQDGDLDLVLSDVMNWCSGWNCSSIPPLELWLNNGTGTFAEASGQLPSQGMRAHQLALRDFDGDGDVDLLTSGDTVITGWTVVGPRLFLNAGAGVFSQTGIPIPSPSEFDCFAIGDVNQDGLLDIAFAAAPQQMGCSDVSSPSVVLNLGGGSFTPLASVATSGPRGVPHLIDVDGDGTLDLLMATYASATVHLIAANTVGPVLVTLPIAVAPYIWSLGANPANMNHTAVGDLDGDGDRDLVAFTAQGNQIVFNDSASQPVAATGALGAPWSPQGFPHAATDFDADGDVDLILCLPDCFTAFTGSVIRVAFNDSTGSLSHVTPFPCLGCPTAAFWAGCVVFDADQDGDVDIYTATHDLLLNAGPSFVWQSLTIASSGPLRAGDLDGDGDVDVVAGGTIILNDGSGTFHVGSTLPPYSASDFELVDLDGDSDLDVVDGRLFLNDGSASFTQAPSLPPGPASSVEAADLDLDFDIDLVLDNRVCLNDGLGGFTQVGTVAGASAQLLALCDVDGDGLPDLLASGFGAIVSPTGRWYRNVGAGAFAPAVNLPAGLMWPIVHADFDGDGDEDLLAKGPSILTNMTRQLSRRMPARPGRPASLDLAGPPGGAWQLYASAGTSNLPLPPLGTVRLDLATTVFVGSGFFSPTGTATVSAITPNVPGIVGLSVYWQAVVYEPQGPRLTGLELTTVGGF